MNKFENHQSTGSSPKSFPDILTPSPSLLPSPKAGHRKGVPESSQACAQGEMYAQISTLRDLSKSHVEGALVEKYGRRSSYEKW